MKIRKFLPIISSFTVLLILVAGIAIVPAQAAEPPEEIEELQQWVCDQGYNYTVAENWVTWLSPEERQALCGYKRVEAPKEPFPENASFSSDVPKAETEGVGQPPSYDAMLLGYVTPVKNQMSPLWCGSCWIHAAVAEFESDVAIGESTLLDFSEQEAGDCNIWSSVGGYNFCLGGNDLMTTNYFTKYGSADETCHAYAATPQSCSGCSILKSVDNWRMITGNNGESQITTIKNAILSYGPVYSCMYASDPTLSAYNSGVYEYWGPEGIDHAIEIIGWDDSLPYSHGTGAWMIKNSWGTGWGTAGPYPGCGWVAYGSANLGDFTSAICGYGNPPDKIFYHDECGWMYWSWGYDVDPTAYGAVRFTPPEDMTLTAVDFWAVDANMNYEIKIFDTLNDLGTGNYTFSSQLGTTQTGTTNEQGYYSIPLNTPVPLTSGDDFIVQAKLTTTGYGYPIPMDYCDDSWLPPWSGIATFSGESYESRDGTQFTKPYWLDEYFDLGIRARAQLPPVELDYGDAPDPTYPTLLVNNGACHNIVSGFHLGSLIDSEPDGQPNAHAMGDDLLDGNDDEDGVVFTSVLIPGQQATLTVTASLVGKLDAWLDFNSDGDWADAGEQIFTSLSLIAGANALSFPVPGDAVLGQTFARFRYSSAGGLRYYGPADDGEVEDYQVFVIEEGTGIPVYGIVRQVDCNPLDGALVEFLYEDAVIPSAPTDIDGFYTVYAPEAGNYTVIARKTGYRDETQESVEVKEGDDSVTLDFCGNTGLIPNHPETSYLGTCIHYWLHPELGCVLDTPKLGSVIHYWLHRVQE